MVTASTALTSRRRATASIRNKLLLDPYARAHVGSLKWNPAVFGYKLEAGDDTTFDERDSAPFIPKCMVVDPRFDWGGERNRKALPWDRHNRLRAACRGSPKMHPAVRPELRGTYAGLGTPEVLRYIKSLGVTAVELMPVHTFVTTVSDRQGPYQLLGLQFASASSRPIRATPATCLELVCANSRR